VTPLLSKEIKIKRHHLPLGPLPKEGEESIGGSSFFAAAAEEDKRRRLTPLSGI